MPVAGFRPRREPGSPVATSAGPIFVARRRAVRPRARPLVLIHGWLMAHGYFSALVDALAGERELVLIDLPGHGESASPSPRSFPYDFDAFVGVIDQVVAQLGLGEFDLLGHSLGGGVALRFAAHRKQVQKLTLVAPLVYRIPEPLEAMLLALPGLGPLLWQRAVSRRDFARTMRRDVEDRSVIGDHYIDWAYERFNRPGARAASYASFDTGRNIPVENATPALVAQPTLVIWGDADRLVPLSHGRRLSAALPAGRLEIIPNTGHTPFIERPGVVVDALQRFWAEPG